MSKPKPPFPPQPLTPPGIEERMDPKPLYRNEAYQAANKLLNKVALITGGDSGIGRAVALLYAKEGANVAIMYLEEDEDAKKTQQEIEQAGAKALTIKGDVTDPEFCKAAVDQVIKKFNKIDILVNNAAYHKHIKTIEELSIEHWEYTFKVNIHGYFYLTKYALEYMRAGGVIINTGSITGIEGSPALLDYSSTKGAIHAFTKSLARNLVNRKIRVNCVAPGPVWTPLNPAERDDEEIKNFGSSTPYGRPAQPEEIAPSFVFLASNVDSGYITGHILPLLGGKTTGL